MFSPTRRGAPKSDPARCARRLTADILIHPQTGCQMMRSGLQGNWERRKRTMTMKSPVPPVGLAQMTRILSRVPTRASLFWNELKVAIPQGSVLNTKGWHGIVTLEFLYFSFTSFPLQPGQWT